MSPIEQQSVCQKTDRLFTYMQKVTICQYGVTFFPVFMVQRMES